MNASEALQQGLNHHQAGHLSEAERFYQDVLRQQPNHPDALHLLGVVAHQQGKNEVAVQLISRAIQETPRPDFYNNCGEAYRVLGKLDEAITQFRMALDIAPEYATTHYNLANTLHQQNCIDEAIKHYRQAIKLNVQYSKAHNNLAVLYKEQKRLDDAIAHLRQAIAISPEYAEAHMNLGVSLQELGDLDSAIDHLKAAVRLDPHNPDAHMNLGVAFKEQRQFNNARTALEQAVTINPQHAAAHTNLGIVLQELGEFDEALACQNRALSINADLLQARYNRSLLLLLNGDFPNAWSDYEYRWQTEMAPRSFQYPQWDGSSLQNHNILVYAEQGIGDEIMFASCIPDVIAQAKLCVIECAEKLVPIFKRSFPKAMVHKREADEDHQWLNDLPQIDYQVASGSLPLYFRKSWNDFPTHHGYLSGDPHRVEYWRNRLQSLGTGLKIGISWRGGIARTRAHLRHIDLREWLPIFNRPNSHFINLQYSECTEELAQLRSEYGISIHHFPEAISNYDETAALLSSLDLVISVCTAVIHLGGALGKPVWILVPAIPEWRYLRSGEQMPWYPSVRMFRQTRLGSWSDVSHEVANRLSTYPS